MKYQFKDLVEAGKEENNDAREQLIVKLHPLIYALIRQYGPTNNLDREDLYQEAVITILYCIKEFDENRNVPFLSYVKRSLMYSVRNGTRETRIKRESSSLNKTLPNSESSLLDFLEDPSLQPAELVEQKELHEALQLAIQQLKPKLRKILMLHYFEETSLQEIAISQNMHYQTAKMAKKRALDSLEKTLFSHVREDV